jgi:hypothetical protein
VDDPLKQAKARRCVVRSLGTPWPSRRSTEAICDRHFAAKDPIEAWRQAGHVETRRFPTTLFERRTR